MTIPPSRLWRIKQVLIADIIDEIDSYFRNLGVRYMLIKGAYLIDAGLAVRLEERRIDDIDILVKEQDYARVCAYFSTLPAVTGVHACWPFESQFTLRTAHGPVLLEIGWLINCRERFVLESGELFDRSRSAGDWCVWPDAVDALLIHVCHILVHIAGDWRESRMQEMMVLGAGADFPWVGFWIRAKTTGIFPFIVFIMSLYRKFYAPETPVPPGTMRTHVALVYWSLKKRHRFPLCIDRAVLEIMFTRRPLRLLWNKLMATRRNEPAPM